MILLIYLPINDLIQSRQHWQKVAEERACQLAAQESYVSLGKITEAISIGLNNPLIKILNKSDSAYQKLEDNIFLFSDEQLRIENQENRDQIIKTNLEKTKCEVTEISQEGQKINELIKDTIPYITQQQERKLVDLNKILDKSWQWVYCKRKKKYPLDIKYIRNYDQFLPTIPTLFSCEIAFRYILDNSYNAVIKKYQSINDPSYVPTIKVTTKNKLDCIEIEIFNNGLGISAKIKQNIQEYPLSPQFLTEKLDLELIISYWILKGSNKGDIYLESVRGKYTKFKIIFRKIKNMDNAE
jgi:hypothetical protein